MTFKVAVDAGHGYNTSGKRTPAGEREWTFNDKVVDAFIAELKNYDGVEVRRYDDPTGKTDVPLSTRTSKANAWGADIYVSFHHNAIDGRWGSHTGTETFYYKGSANGKKLADLLQKANVKAYGLRDRGLKTANLHITRETRGVAALVEGGFMDSTIDIKKMRNNSVLANAGKYSAQAVAKYAGLKRREKKEPAKTKYLEVTTSTLWTYDKPDWSAKHKTVKKGEVFTINRTLTVDGSTMHQLKSGLYITNNPKFVRVYSK